MSPRGRSSYAIRIVSPGLYEGLSKLIESSTPETTVAIADPWIDRPASEAVIRNVYWVAGTPGTWYETVAAVATPDRTSTFGIREVSMIS